MKRKLKRLAVLCLSLVLTLCLALPVWAEPAQTYDITQGQTGSITVDNVESGATVDIYQLVTVQFDTNNQQPVEPMYTWVSGVANWVRANYRTYIGNDNSVTTDFSSTIAETDSATFYDALAAAIRSNNVQLTATTATIDASGSHTFTNLAMGNYLIIVEDSVKVYRPSAANLIPVWDSGSNSWNMSKATVKLKSSALSLIKTVFDKSTDLTDEDYNNLESKQAQVAIGDTVTYMLVADVPSYPASATATGYQISDSLPNGMELNPDSIQVYGIDASTANTSAGTLLDNYTLTTSNATRPVTTTPAVSFKLAFNYNSIKSYSKIRVVYTATANASIKVIGQNNNNAGNQNTAYLDYNNNPYESPAAPGLSWETAQDTATVYTYGIDISKVDATKPSMYLPGATFKLSTKPDAKDDDDFIKFKSDGNGTYHKDATTGSTELTVGNQVNDDTSRLGRLTLNGLDVDTYYLYETKAPAGYVKLSTPVLVTIADDGTGADNTAPDGIVNDGSNGYVSTSVKNHTGFTLPSTGGIGTVLFTTFGIVLMGGGFALLMVYLRRRNRAK